MYCNGWVEGQVRPNDSFCSLISAHTNCVYPSLPGVNDPACVVLFDSRAVSSKPHRFCAESATVTVKCCFTPGA